MRGWGKQKSVFQAVATRYTPLLFPHNHNYTYTNLLGPGGITNRVKLSLSTLAFSCKKCKINNFGNKTWTRRKPQSQSYTGENKSVNQSGSLCLSSYPMIRYSDMDENMKKEVMDVCTTACERHTANNELVRREKNLFQNLNHFIVCEGDQGNPG